MIKQRWSGVLSVSDVLVLQVMSHLVNNLCHFPMAGGAARMSSAVRECHDLAQYSAGELTSQIFDAPTVQVLVQLARRRRFSTLVMLRYTERLLKYCYSTVIYCDLTVSVLRSQQHDASVFR